jgi:hypothetical protein
LIGFRLHGQDDRQPEYCRRDSRCESR